MQRRTMLGLGVAAGGLLAVAGGTLAWWQPAWRQGRLAEPARQMMRAVAQAVLEGVLPADMSARQAALDAHLTRLQDTLQGLPPAMQAEVDQLFTLLCHPAGRLGLAQLAPRWTDASTAQVTEALQRLRGSALAVRRQAYRALRDLTNSAYFADASTWAVLGYPGPRAV